MVKSLIEFVLCLAFGSPALNNDGVTSCVVLRFEVSDINLAWQLTVNALEGFLNQFGSLVRKFASQCQQELLPVNDTVFVLIEDGEHLLHIQFWDLHLESKDRSHKLVQIQSARLVSVNLIEVVLQFNKAPNASQQ